MQPGLCCTDHLGKHGVEGSCLVQWQWSKHLSSGSMLSIHEAKGVLAEVSGRWDPWKFSQKGTRLREGWRRTEVKEKRSFKTKNDRDVREARSLPAFEILCLVWQAKNLMNNIISIHFSLKMPSRFEKCFQLLIKPTTRSHIHCSVLCFFLTNLENFVVSFRGSCPAPSESPTLCCNAEWCRSIVADPRAFTQPLAELSFERTRKSKENLKYDQKTVSSHLQYLEFSPQVYPDWLATQ